MAARADGGRMTSHPGSGRAGFEYVVLRCVPRVDRSEFVNVGVIVYSQASQYLAAAWQVDEDRLRALFAEVDVPAVCAALEVVTAVCAGDPSAGPRAEGTAGDRFRWLSAPRSTVIQPGPVHGGLTTDPAAELDRLLATVVG
jgi:hypothetical protein